MPFPLKQIQQLGQEEQIRVKSLASGSNTQVFTIFYNYMEKADFLYFEVEAPKGIILIMFTDRSITISAKIRKNLGAYLSNKPFNASK